MLSNGVGMLCEIWAVLEMAWVGRRLYERGFCNGDEERCMELEVLKRRMAD
jgi:hypothetical protein